MANGVEGDMVRAMYSSLLADGAVPRLVGSKLGKVQAGDGSVLHVEITLEAGPSVLWDAVIVPDGVLFGSSNAHKELRRMVVEEQKLDAVISLPSGAFKPYAGVSTAILLFTKTNSGGTDHVWFYDMKADGWSLDDKRQPLLDASLVGLQRFQLLLDEVQRVFTTIAQQLEQNQR